MAPVGVVRNLVRDIDTMSLLLAAIIFSCVFVASHTAPQEQGWTEDVVSYSGFQLWSAKPRKQEEREFLLKIRQDYGNEIISCSHIKRCRVIPECY